MSTEAKISIINENDQQSMDQSEAFRIAMRQWASGVGIATSVYKGNAHGMTISSFTSIAVQPPTLLVSLAKRTRTHELVMASGILGITLLNLDQREISQRFAGRTHEEGNRFEGIETFVMVTGAPMIKNGLAFFDCRIHQTLDMTETTLFIADVIDSRTNTGGKPLIYYNRDYHRLQE